MCPAPDVPGPVGGAAAADTSAPRTLAGLRAVIPADLAWMRECLRREHGRKLMMIGGFDKRILAASKADIRKEFKRLWPVVEEGGSIPTCDHGWPHDIPFANACCYMETLKGMCGVT
jgi:hypothetical protein